VFEDILALDISSFERAFGCAFVLCEYGASRTVSLDKALDRNDQMAAFFLLLTGTRADEPRAPAAQVLHVARADADFGGSD
jgi:hypothetical protein